MRIFTAMIRLAHATIENAKGMVGVETQKAAGGASPQVQQPQPGNSVQQDGFRHPTVSMNPDAHGGALLVVPLTKDQEREILAARMREVVPDRPVEGRGLDQSRTPDRGMGYER